MSLVSNPGRLRNTMSGITGVSPGSVAVVNLPVNQRVHRLQFNCGAVNYTAPTVSIVGAGTYNATLTPTVVQGQITAVVITAAGSGMTNGTYTTASGAVVITDSTGIGAQFSVTISSGAVASVTVVSGGTPGPINPATMVTSLRILVNGVVIRDITPQQALQIATANGYLAQFGTLPVFFTEPWRNMLRDNTLTSWDLAGQNTFQIQMGISAAVVSPVMTGLIEFDYQRNARTVKTAAQSKNTGIAIGGRAPFLMPVSHHAFGYPLAVGLTPITTLPWNNRILRLWLVGSSPGNIYNVEVQVDKNIVFQNSAQQIAEDASEYGFQVGNVFAANVQGGGYGNGTPFPGNTVSGTGVKQQPTTIPNGQLSQSTYLEGAQIFPFDAAVIFDIDQRPWSGQQATTNFILRVWSAAAQNLTILMEALPQGYNG